MASAEAEILKLARQIAPSAHAESWATKESFSCAIIVASDEEKNRINGDQGLLETMRVAASNAGRRPDFLTAESQETVDRRYNGDWSYIFR